MNGLITPRYIEDLLSFNNDEFEYPYYKDRSACLHADAGFHLFDALNVKCRDCNAIVSLQEETILTADPFDLHLSMSPNCVFVRERCNRTEPPRQEISVENPGQGSQVNTVVRERDNGPRSEVSIGDKSHWYDFV